jgi:polysaccharide export outer membrane protein
MLNKLLLFSLLCLLSSCVSTRNLIYLRDLEGQNSYVEEIKNNIELKIQPDDVLSITVSSLNPEANMLFNSGVMPSAAGSTSSAVVRVPEGYLVDKNGEINFPVLGKIKLLGLTKEQATEKMTAEINKNVKNPIVNVKFLNFRITVIGEVNRPSSFTVPSEKISLLEALGLAGDMTVYGKRENVLIIREQSGKRTVNRVNLSSKSILNSPDFYLQQNDVVYVEPTKLKAVQGSSGVFYLSLVTTAATIISILTILLK